jgi:regulator of replication initiation timing
MEGMLKKVQTDQVMVTPNPQTRIKLSELNKMLTEMKQGEQAVKRMAEIDQSRGLQDPKDVAKRKRGETPTMDSMIPPLQAPATGALDDASIAAGLQAQATAMEAQAKSLIAESKRLQAEAAALLPKKAAKKTTAKVAAKPATVAKTTRAKKVTA